MDYCLIPAGVPPNGQMYNFDNPPSWAPALVGVTATMIIWSAIFLAGRLWVNRRRLEIADYCAIVAFVISAGYSGIILAMKDYLRHMYDIPACWFNASYIKFTCAMQILMPLAHSFSKASILLLFLQILSVKKNARLAIYAGLILIVLDYGPNLILGPWYTVPRSGETWEDLLTNGRPAHLNKVGLEQAVLAVIIDLYIFILPLPMLSKLNLGLAKRLQLAFVFGTALMGVIASIIGLVLRVPLLTTTDLTWVQGKIFICIMVEIYIAIIVSCLPACANIAKTTKTRISNSDFYKSLTSLLRSEKGESSVGSTRGPTNQSWLARIHFGGTRQTEKSDIMQTDTAPCDESDVSPELLSARVSMNHTDEAIHEMGLRSPIHEMGLKTPIHEMGHASPTEGITRTYQVDQSFRAREKEATRMHHTQQMV